MSRASRLSLPRALFNLVLAAFTASCLFPVIWIAYTSFKTLKEFNASVVAPPKALYLDNFVRILKTAKFGAFFLNSLWSSALTLAAVLMMAFLAGYFLSRWKFKGRDLIYFVFMIGMFVPTQAWLLPVFIQFKRLGLLDRRLTLVLPYVAFALPIAVFLVESFVRAIPFEMEESATMDGCGLWRCLASIIFPLCRPIVATMLILTFNTSWNEFPFALVLINKSALKTVPVALTMFTGTYTTNYPLLVSALLIAIVPVVVVYFLFSKLIVKGMTAGAVKG